ncbi:hypothetical protein MAF45_07480 [Mesosutterella sp. OilRF-GAM-744-9]|uniref:MYND-type domain-containing protein n=1 Tax=Mesosutterella porci TaxID=2915351 RepID=A0ABS9MSH6_9BURK|nr:PP0621 family protein [Mesosutterella sp. oilRF-744-WT-GAM-9]MCG5031279.1 hypothetical protein [Mesosutterella sp. oilRF-744-WT-GAM-9]
MGLIRLLPWIILIVIAFVFLSRKKRERERSAMEEELKAMRRQLNARQGPAEGGASEEMARCPHCGTYFLRRDGVIKNGRLYCSRSCARKDA